MIRTKLAARLAAAAPPSLDKRLLLHACAAAELAHTASLIHDDVIDGGLVRRSSPTLWRVAGASAAVLIGDALLCEALDLLMAVRRRRYVRNFVRKVGEMCRAEALHELLLRGRPVDVPMCLRIARRKTGPLFAFVAGACAGTDRVLHASLEEAGYRIGTAYQLADDLADVVGDEAQAGKTLGRDFLKHKPTLPHILPDGPERTQSLVAEHCRAALDTLSAWPGIQKALAAFRAEELDRLFERSGLGVGLAGEARS
jgi:geranylgeranyl pyrophosphate synthase